MAAIQRVPAPVTYDMRQVGLVRALHSIQPSQLAGVRLEADHVGMTGPQQRSVGRRAVDGAGTDVDHLDARVNAGQCRERPRRRPIGHRYTSASNCTPGGREPGNRPVETPYSSSNTPQELTCAPPLIL